MRPLLLHGFGTSVRVNGRTLEVEWRSEDRKESFRPQQLPFDSVVVDSMTGSVSFESHCSRSRDPSQRSRKVCWK